MSSTTLPGEFASRREESESLDSALQKAVVSVLEVIGSLKLTCLMFALSMVIVFVGSLAQSRRRLAGDGAVFSHVGCENRCSGSVSSLNVQRSRAAVRG